jgi:hypothetical protein
MSRSLWNTRARGRLRRRLCVTAVGGIASLVAAGISLAAGPSGAVPSSASGPVAQPVVIYAPDPTLIGASPAEHSGEVWGYSTADGFQILRYTDESGWQPQPAPEEADGQSLSGFAPAAGPLAGSTTPDGGVAIVGTQVLVRDPDGAFREAPALTTEPSGSEPPAPNALLKPGETLSAPSGEGVLMSAIEQPGDDTGVFLVPHESSSTQVQDSVLFYDGDHDGDSWTREPICEGIDVSPCRAPASGFEVLAIDASSPQNAWLLAKTGSGAEGIVLFQRNTAGPEPVWEQRSLGSSPYAQADPTLEIASTHEHTTARVSALTNGQPLTVTSAGVWVDGQLTVASQSNPIDFTFFYKPGSSGAGGEVAASWCDAPSTLAGACTHDSAEFELPGGAYRSFAWNEGGPYGERVITGLGGGVSLSLHDETFTTLLGIGDSSGAAGAAFSSPENGWLGGEPLTHIAVPELQEPDELQSWPVPFRRPIAAIAEQPGATPGELSAQAIVVGNEGEVAHYIPGQGWTPEALLSSSGVAQTNTNLRGVAWPEPGRAYAVGTGGAMWLWQADTGLWEPDPARPPNLVLANFTGIAFDPSEPTRGYAIGQQGVLLGFGKTWAQEALPPGLEGADFTSIAFAGNEALVSYQIPKLGQSGYSGGLLVNDGSGWTIDEEAASALGGGVPARVAGLPDGGAALATSEGAILERQGGPGTPWQPAPGGSLHGYPAALAAFREGGTLRTVVSLDREGEDENRQFAVDRALQVAPPPGQAPVATEAYPLPAAGYLLRETTDGWKDMEHEDYPDPGHQSAVPGVETGVDWPDQPDAVLALALDPASGQGWAVGGQTGELNANLDDGPQIIDAIQTAGVMRYPADGTPPPGFSSSPEATGTGNATFAIGGDAQCASPCADLSDDQLGPVRWLTNAIERAGETPGVRDFLYTGPHLAPGLGAAGFAREESIYSDLLSTPTVDSGMGVYAAPSETDIDPAGGLASFEAAMGAHAPARTAPPATHLSLKETGAYAFESPASPGGGGAVWVIVLDYSRPSLGEEQQCWLAHQLGQAKEAQMPAIVMGSRELSSPSVIATLATGNPPAGCTFALSEKTGAASAYFYDSPQANRSRVLTVGGAPLPTFGSGTLGYIEISPEIESMKASGFLLAEVQTAKREPGSNRAPVAVRLIPDISELALDATNGVLLRRSAPALFTALARRPQAGMLCTLEGGSCLFQPDPYVPIPSVCEGPECASAIFPEYTFTSSNPEVGSFVEPDPSSTTGTVVLQEAAGKPIPDAHSGLFCAYNPGTTTVTIKAGGLAASEQVTVQGGSVEQPCGTVPLQNPPAPIQRAALPVPVPTPAPAAAQPVHEPLPPPAPPAVPSAHPQPHPVALPPAPFAPAQLFPILPLVPPPPPAAGRPTPPSGTAQVPAQSPVSQTVGVAEHEHEEQSATEMVHHMAMYEPSRRETPLPSWPLGLVLLAVGAGVALRRPRAHPACAVVRTNPDRHSR